jgi:PPM family protein phosphatase
MIPSERSHLFLAATSHPGMSGKNNEDNYAVSAHWLSDAEQIPSVLAIVADGVGGHRAGEVASEIATEIISKVIVESDAANPQEILNFAVVKAGQAVNDQSEANERQHGMGSTCACVWVIDNRLFTAAVGDSRIYFIREGVIRKITIDHTWVQEAIEHGIINPDQARNHPRAHVIRRYLGSKKPVEPDFRLRLTPEETDDESLANQGMELLPDDQILLCSDGLTDLVDDSEILEILQTKELQAALEHLVHVANGRGGHDNITIVSLQVPESKISPAPGKSIAKNGSKVRWQTLVALSIFLIIVTGLSVLVFLYWSSPVSEPPPTATIPATQTMLPAEILTTEPDDGPATLPPPTHPPDPTDTPSP